MPRRRNKRKEYNSKELLLYVAGGAMILLVLVAVVVLVLLKPEAAVRDPVTLCRSEGPYSITAILLDRTDSFGTHTKNDLKVQIQNLLDLIEENHELSLFAMESTHENGLDPIIRVCNPGDPENVDPLIQSEAIVRRNWQQKFRQPLEKVLRTLLHEKEAPSSPIMESVQSVSITHFQDTNRRSVPRRLIIISDLLQNSDVLSFYREPPNFQRFQRTHESRGLNPDLRGVDIELWLIQRRQPQQGDGGALLKFFQSWLSQHGGQVVRALRISGMND